MDYNKNFLNTDTPDFWTREMQRVLQFTNIEQDIRRFKSMGEWEQLLNAAEDLLELQMEVMEEKVVSADEEGNKTTTVTRGKTTARYKKSDDKIKNLRTRVREGNGRYTDPARRRNNTEERFLLETEIRELIADLYQNNIELGLTYKKQADPRKAALG
jgi:hypothetical protein